MPAVLTIRDESPFGATLQEWKLEFLTERITVRELIRSRVYQEVQDYNLKKCGNFRGLTPPPVEPEHQLNKNKPIEWQSQFDRALRAFESGRVLILVDDRQVELLDDEITIGPETKVSFLRLTLLAG